MRKTSILIGILLLVLFAIYQSRRLERDAKDGYAIFNSQRLEGEIISVSTSGGLTFIKLDNTDKTYTFTPVALEPNEDKLFYITAKPGDSIFKNSYSDTLELIHKGQNYFYTFVEF